MAAGYSPETEPPELYVAVSVTAAPFNVKLMVSPAATTQGAVGLI